MPIVNGTGINHCISSVKFRLNDMFKGWSPVAEHDTWLPGSILTAVCKTILGGTGEVMFEFS